MNFLQDLAALLNREGYDTQLNMPDYVLAEYLEGHLALLGIAQRDSAKHRTGQLEQRLERIERLLIHNLKNESIIMTDLTQLTQAVNDSVTVEESAITLLNGLKAQLDAAGTDPVALKALSDSLAAEKDKLAAAITANTPAAPAGGEGADGGGSQG